MKKIKSNVYIESSYPGVTVGAICWPEGTVLVDSPLRPEDSHAWLAALKKVGAKEAMILVNQDSHPDRSLGAQELKKPLMMHSEAARELRQRAAIFKSLKQESGAEWENLDGLRSLRWLQPELQFTEETEIKLGANIILVRAAAGPSPGACWVILPEEKIMFVGDAVTKNEVPFIAEANIAKWLESLDLLLSKDFKDYRMISGRGGEVGVKEIRETRRFLSDMESRLEKLAKRKVAYAEAGKLAEKIFDKYKYPAKYKKIWIQRLRHGLQNYYISKYFPALKTSY